MTSTHKHHIISIQYPSHKCLPEKSCLYCLRILIMHWLFKDPVVIMKEIMSWLFKDPVVIMKKISPDCLRIQLTVTWLNLTMPNQTVKNDLKAKKIKLPQMNFFSWKTTNLYKQLFMYLLPPFILQNVKKILRAGPELSGCAIFGPKMAHLSWTNFLWYKPLLLLSSTYWSFSLCKI